MFANVSSFVFAGLLVRSFLCESVFAWCVLAPLFACFFDCLLACSLFVFVCFFFCSFF